jgi:HSP20 family protein
MTLRSLIPSLGKKRATARHDYNSPYGLFHSDIDRLFDDFFNDFELDIFGGRTGSFSPRVEVSEDEKEIRVSAELPGLDEKDISVSITGDSLTLSGEKKEESESKDKGYFLKERSYGSFTRTIPLYSDIKTDMVEAHFKKGVLRIHLPKTAKAVDGKKKIEVSTE